MQTARENLSLEVAVLVSLLLHAASIVCYEQRGTLARFSLFKPVVKVLSAAFAPPKYARVEPAPQTITFVEAARREPPQPAPEPEREPPRQFMETDNSQVTGQQPKDAQYYSDRSTVAANPENPTGKTGDTPYLDGKETRPVMSTENVPLQPGAPGGPMTPAPAAAAQPPPLQPPPVATPAEQPKEVADKGLKAAEEKQLAMIAQESATMQRAAQPQSSAPVPGPVGRGPQREIPAIKSHLVVSGVNRIGVAAFDVAEGTWGLYDKQLIRAITSRWHMLIGTYGIYERTGEVKVAFELYDDGTVHNLKRQQNTAGEILALFCEKAILESAPFEPFSDKLRTLVGKEPRPVEITFYY